MIPQGRQATEVRDGRRSGVAFERFTQRGQDVDAALGRIGADTWDTSRTLPDLDDESLTSVGAMRGMTGAVTGARQSDWL